MLYCQLRLRQFMSAVCLIVDLYFSHILFCCAAVILMEGGSEFDLKSIDADDETTKNLNIGSEKQPNNR